MEGSGKEVNLAEVEVDRSGKVQAGIADLAYTAGLLDGEGTVGIAKSKKHCYGLQVQIYNSDLPIMVWLKDNFGGSFHTRERSNSERFHYRWYLAGAKAASFLQQIEPFTKIKRRQVTAALGFWEEWRGSLWKRRTQTELGIAEDYRSLVASYNQRKGE